MKIIAATGALAHRYQKGYQDQQGKPDAKEDDHSPVGG